MLKNKNKIVPTLLYVKCRNVCPYDQLRKLRPIGKEVFFTHIFWKIS